MTWRDILQWVVVGIVVMVVFGWFFNVFFF
jgi:hypothetical protein